MSYTRGLVFAAAIAVTTGAFVQPSAAASCPERMAALDRAVAARSLADVKRLETAIFQARMECIDDRPAAREKRAALEVALATEPDGSLRTDAEREAALVDAATRSDSWRASKALADFQAEHRRFVEAAATYDASIERALQFDHPSDAQRKELMRLAGAAKLLASDDRGGTANVPLKLSSRASNGLTGGIFSPALRGRDRGGGAAAHPVRHSVVGTDARGPASRERTRDGPEGARRDPCDVGRAHRHARPR